MVKGRNRLSNRLVKFRITILGEKNRVHNQKGRAISIHNGISYILMKAFASAAQLIRDDDWAMEIQIYDIWTKDVLYHGTISLELNGVV